jgi:hypothetical protein
LSNRGFQWKRAAIAAVLSLAVLSLGYYVYNSYGVTKPLERVLSSNPDVVSLELNRDGKIVEVTAKLNQVEDLKNTYDKIDSLLRQTLGDGTFKLTIEDTRNAELEEAYYAIHYYIEEASQNGSFGDMITSSREILASLGIDDYRIIVDKERLFVQIQEDQSYLYEIVDRVIQGERGSEL